MKNQLISLLLILCTFFLFVASPAFAFSFGDNASQWAYDDECDDPRFTGPGMASSLDYANISHDASDCKDLYYNDEVFFENDYVIEEKDDGFYDVEDTEDEFGDNSSDYANDGQCDDPRFNGSGMAGVLNNEDTGRDEHDCRMLYLEGNIDWN